MIRKAAAVVLAAALILCLTAVSGAAATILTEGNFKYEIVGDGAFVCGYVTKPTGALTIPATLGGYPVTCVEASSFSGCSGLTSVTIPDSVTEIGPFVFMNCTALT